MSIEIIFSGVGAIALGVNAFFLKGIYSDLNAVKISIARIFERSNAKEKQIKDLEENQKAIFERLRKLEKDAS